MKPQPWWTDERVEELKARWLNRETGTMIAIAMHAKSRNAVIGKLSRLGLRRGPDPNSNGHNGHNRGKRQRQIGRATLHYVDGRVFIVTGEQMIEEPPIFDNPKPFIALKDGDCRFPGDGRGADMACCGAPAIDGKPYCLVHCRIAYVKAGSRPRP